MLALREQFSQLLVWGDLLPFVESVVGFEVFVDMVEGDFIAVLVVHDSSADDIFFEALSN